MWTSLVTKEKVEQCAEQIKLCPCIFQEYVQKKTELRVTVIGTQIFGAELFTQDDEQSRVDWRKRNVFRMKHAPIVLPVMLQKQILDLMGVLGLVFGCLDFVRTPDDEFVFLELNPNGQWIWIEQILELPMTEALVNLMIEQGQAIHGIR